tara:strand:- start:1869 stop:3116 length:1248 start_codon:yes stop_codon:yes gene_type:complete
MKPISINFDLLSSFFLVFFCFFPFIKISIFGTSTDLQIYAFLISIIIICKNFNKTKFNLSYLFIPPTLLSILIFFFDLSFSLENLKFLYNYISFPVVFYASYSCIKEKKIAQENNLIFILILIWFIIGLIQYKIDATFLTSLLYDPRGFGTYGRGIGALAPEPSIYGLMCLLFLILTIEKKMIISSILLIIQIFLFSASTTAILISLIVINIYLFFLISNKSKILLTISLIFCFLNQSIILDFSTKYLNKNLRIYNVLEQYKHSYSNNDSLIKINLESFDVAIQARIKHVVLPFKKWTENYAVPNGIFRYEIDRDFYTAFPKKRNLGHGSENIINFYETSNTIMSGHSRAAYELGIFSLFYILITYLIFKKYSNKKLFIQLRLFFSFNLILLMPISYANPIIAFMLGYFYGKKNY